ncbi:MAG: hypothetical protein GY953_31490 [bacterium]|nr:hypothetical protein [bacterium]
MTSFYGFVQAKPGTLLLGGTTEVESSRFESADDAAAWVDTMIQQPNADTFGVVPSERAPEIMHAENLGE